DISRIAAAYEALTSAAPDPLEPAAYQDDLLLSTLAAAIAPETAAEACLVPALAALGWTGVVRDIKEALPHFERVRDVDALRSVLARLNYQTHARPANLRSLSAAVMPCLFSSSGLDV